MLTNYFKPFCSKQNHSLQYLRLSIPLSPYAVLHLSRPALGPTQPPVQRVPRLSWGVKGGQGVTLTPYPLIVPWSRKSRATTLLPLWGIQPVKSLSACTVQLYLYSPYGPYSLYRASVPVQNSYTSTPPMGRMACTEPQCLYSTAIPLLPLWTVQSIGGVEV